MKRYQTLHEKVYPIKPDIAKDFFGYVLMNFKKADNALTVLANYVGGNHYKEFTAEQLQWFESMPRRTLLKLPFKIYRAFNYSTPYEQGYDADDPFADFVEGDYFRTNKQYSSWTTSLQMAKKRGEDSIAQTMLTNKYKFIDVRFILSCFAFAISGGGKEDWAGFLDVADKINELHGKDLDFDTMEKYEKKYDKLVDSFSHILYDENEILVFEKKLPATVIYDRGYTDYEAI